MSDPGETRELLPGGPVEAGSVDKRFAPTHHQVFRRPMGVGPVPLLAGLSGFALLIGLILLLTGDLIAGLIVLALTVALAALFRAATRSEPDSEAARLAIVAEDRARGGARLAAATGRAWSRAMPELVRIRARQQRLNRELKSRLEPLGEAVHKGDRQRAAALKAQADQLERAIADAEREESAVKEAVGNDVRRERATSEPTQPIAPVTTRAPQRRRRP